MKSFHASLLLVALSLLFAQPAISQSMIPQTGNEAYRELERLLKLELASTPPTNAVSDKPLSQMAPAKIWEQAENAMLFSDGFPSFEYFTALSGLLEAIESHPKKSEFVDLMLQRITTTSLPTGAPKDWNEIAIIGRGGIAGLLISSVTKVAEPADYQRIIEAVLATNDAAKIAKLREAASLVSGKDEFERLLKLHGPGAVGTGREPTKTNPLAPPSQSHDFRKKANSASAIKEPTPMKDPSTLQATTTINEQPTSSTLWSIVVIVIAAAIGLLWLLVKKHK